MNNSFEVTHRWLNDFKTPRGGYNRKQLDSIGVGYPPKKGWPARLNGRLITQEQRESFEYYSENGNKVSKQNKYEPIEARVSELEKQDSLKTNYIAQLEERIERLEEIAFPVK